jgi:hypothetical protein
MKKADLAMLRMRKTYVEQKRQNKAVARVSQLICRSLMVLKERGDLSELTPNRFSRVKVSASL